MQGISFVYDGVPSEEYNLGIVYIGNDGESYPSGSGVEITADSLLRSAQMLYLNGRQTPVLEFEFCVASETPFDGYTLSRVKQWLFGALSYRKLQICLEDLRHLYFNCTLSADGDYVFLGGYYGFNVKVTCDAPFAWEYPRTFSGALGDAVFYNTSADAEDLMPILRLHMADAGDFSIVNHSYDDRALVFTGLSKGEEITVDNRKGMITSTEGRGRLAKFNKCFLRLRPGVNRLTITAPAGTTYEIEYTNAVRMGGGLY